MGQQLADLSAQRDQEPPDGPVFVDETGRRSRRYRRIGVIVGLACAAYAVVIVATLLSGNSSAPWLPVQGSKPESDKPAGKVDTSQLPTDPASPSTTPGATPGPSASGTNAVEPEPGESSTAGATPSGDASGKPDPGTSTGGGKPDPTGKPTKPDPDPTGKPTTTPDPDPTKTSDPPVDPPTESPDPGTVSGGGGEGGGPGPVAGGQATATYASSSYHAPEGSASAPEVVQP
ncbi:hypothetical protein ACQB60_28150 [Actinomycetota bacterium Odt1-20B]